MLSLSAFLHESGISLLVVWAERNEFHERMDGNAMAMAICFSFLNGRRGSYHGMDDYELELWNVLLIASLL